MDHNCNRPDPARWSVRGRQRNIQRAKCEWDGGGCAAAPVIDPATPRSAPIRAVLPAHDALA